MSCKALWSTGRVYLNDDDDEDAPSTSSTTTTYKSFPTSAISKTNTQLNQSHTKFHPFSSISESQDQRTSSEKKTGGGEKALVRDRDEDSAMAQSSHAHGSRCSKLETHGALFASFIVVGMFGDGWTVNFRSCRGLERHFTFTY